MSPKTFLKHIQQQDKALVLTLLICNPTDRSLLTIVPNLEEDSKTWLPDTRSTTSGQALENVVRDMMRIWTSLERNAYKIHVEPVWTKKNALFVRVDLLDPCSSLAPSEDLKRALGDAFDFSYRFVQSPESYDGLGNGEWAVKAARRLFKQFEEERVPCPRCPGSQYHSEGYCPARKAKKMAKNREAKKRRAQRLREGTPADEMHAGKIEAHEV